MAVYAIADAYFRGGPLHGEIREVEHPLPEEVSWYVHLYQLTGRVMDVNGERFPVYQHDDEGCCDGWRGGVYADEDDECE